MSEYIVETQELSKHYTIGGSTIKALDNVSIKIKRGEYVSLVGPSGSGKTTTGRCILRLYRPTEGKTFLTVRKLPNGQKQESDHSAGGCHLFSRILTVP
jgi:oligopeptide transport system ATP-binding protein